MKTNVESIMRKMEAERVGAGRRDGRGKVHKSKRQQSPRRVEESEEIKAYLNKLQDIVPFMPKNKRLSKLEVISYVIEYIRDLRQTLGLPPSCVNEDDSDFDILDTDSAMIAALTQVQVAAAAKPPTAVATLTVINNPALATEPAAYCHHPHAPTRQPLVAIANPTDGSR